MRKACLSIVLTVCCFPVFSQDFQWAKNFGGYEIDKANSMAVDPAGNVYVTGAFEYTADFDPGPGVFSLTSQGGVDLFVCKLDPSGNFCWAGAIGGNYDERGHEVAVNSEGEVVVTGSFRGVMDFDPAPAGVFEMESVDSYDAFVLKLDKDGKFLWARQLGSMARTQAYSITVDPGGNIYTTGYFDGTGDFDPGPDTFAMTSALFSSNTFISKLDPDGAFVWAKNIGGGNTVPQKISLDLHGNVYVTGEFRDATDFDPGPDFANILSIAGSADAFVLKLDTAGDYVWAKRLGGIDGDFGNSVAVDANGNVYTAGYFKGECNFNPDPANPFRLQAVGNYDIFISKLDENGQFVWAKSIGTTSNETPYGIALDAAADVYITGQFLFTTDFDPGPGVFNLTSVGNYDVFLLKLDTGGDFIAASAVGGGNPDGGESVWVDPAGNIYIAGFFRNGCDFDPGWMDHSIASNGLQDAFVLKLGQPNADAADILSQPMLVFPNPAKDETWVQVPFSSRWQVELFDAMGNQVQSIHAGTDRIRLELKDLVPGVYFIRASDGWHTWSARLLR
ncbi:MAG: SBBP repeat-containing protein [Saprospiraceae bacterium]|nr:SBBP repeat-containing protein [Saprospiraceae bacterium]